METLIKNTSNVIDARAIFAKIQRSNKQPFLDYQCHLLAEYDVYSQTLGNMDLYTDEEYDDYEELNFNEER